MKKVRYQGKSYLTNVEKDRRGAGGIWDLSCAFASTICGITDPCNYEHYEDIQEEVYELIKYGVIGQLENTM